MRYRIAHLEVQHSVELAKEINDEVMSNERVVSASFGTREYGPEEWKTTWTTATLLIEAVARDHPPLYTSPEDDGYEDLGFMR